MILRKYGTAATIDGIPLITRDAMDYIANPTLEAGDVQISKDGGEFANVTDLPTVTPAGATVLQVTLTADEMEAARIVVRCIDQTEPKAWEDQEIIIETFGHASAQFAVDLSDGAGMGLSRLDAAISSRVTAGTGAAERTIAIVDEGANPIVGAEVWLTSDEAGSQVVAGTLTTDDAGEVTFLVDVGSTYYVWCDSPAANFTNPLEWEVS